MSSTCGVLLKFSMDMLCPSMDDLYKIKAILKSSQAVVNHSVILQTTISPAIVTFSKDETLRMLKYLQCDDWEKVMRDDAKFFRLR
jgi:hypothetical protein